MTSGWETKMLGDVAEVIAGQSPEGSFYNTSGDGLPFYQGKKEFGEKGIGAPTTWTSQITKIALEGDVLMSVRAPVGPVNFATQKSCIGRGLAAIRSGKDLDRNFLFYFLLSKQEEINGTEGAVFASINKNDIKSIKIAVPPISEQQRIVGILDEAFDGIATAKTNADKNLQNTRALFESHLQSVFTRRGEGWVEKTLGDVFTTVTGNTPPKNNAEFYGDFMPLVKPPELCDAPFDSAADGLSEAGAAVARTLPPKSVLVSCIGNLGKIGFNLVPVAFNQQINAILPDESHAIPEFMFFQVLSSAFKDQLEALVSGTTVPIVNKSKFNSVEVVLLPLPKQKTIVAQLNLFRQETQRLESLYQRKLAALEALKKSLLHQAFTGEL
jgi:type I restriction enzyme, S subunit